MTGKQIMRVHTAVGPRRSTPTASLVQNDEYVFLNGNEVTVSKPAFCIIGATSPGRIDQKSVNGGLSRPSNVDSIFQNTFRVIRIIHEPLRIILGHISQGGVTNQKRGKDQAAAAQYSPRLPRHAALS